MGRSDAVTAEPALMTALPTKYTKRNMMIPNNTAQTFISFPLKSFAPSESTPHVVSIFIEIYKSVSAKLAKSPLSESAQTGPVFSGVQIDVRETKSKNANMKGTNMQLMPFKPFSPACTKTKQRTIQTIVGNRVSNMLSVAASIADMMMK